MEVIDIVAAKRRRLYLFKLMEKCNKNKSEAFEKAKSVRIEGETGSERIARCKATRNAEDMPEELLREWYDLNKVIHQYSKTFLGQCDVPDIIYFTYN